VLLADYELRLLAPGGGEQLTLPVEASGGGVAEPGGPV